MTKTKERTMYLHALQKWEWLSNGENYSREILVKTFPHLREYSAGCSFCHNLTCRKCPLGGRRVRCYHAGQLYDLFCTTITAERRQKHAEALRDLIKKLAEARGYTFTDAELSGRKE